MLKPPRGVAGFKPIKQINKGALTMDNKYKESLVADKFDNEYATYILTDNKDNHVSFLLEKINTTWYIVCFMGGKAHNSSYRKSWINKEVYEKCGRGRESKASKELIKELYSIALENISRM